MTTNEAVEYIENYLLEVLKPLRPLASTDSQVANHLFKVNEAMGIIKADLKGGFQHYTGDKA